MLVIQNLGYYILELNQLFTIFISLDADVSFLTTRIILVNLMLRHMMAYSLVILLEAKHIDTTRIYRNSDRFNDQKFSVAIFDN